MANKSHSLCSASWQQPIVKIKESAEMTSTVYNGWIWDAVFEDIKKDSFCQLRMKKLGVIRSHMNNYSFHWEGEWWQQLLWWMWHWEKVCNCVLKVHIPFPDDQSCGKEEWLWKCWLGIIRSLSGRASTVCTVLTIRRWVGGSWHYFGEGAATFLAVGLSAGELVEGWGLNGIRRGGEEGNPGRSFEGASDM